MTVSDLLARTTSRELTEYQLYYELLHDEQLYYHEHPHSTPDEYRDAREKRDEHLRRIGREDRLDEDDDEDDDRDGDDAA